LSTDSSGITSMAKTVYWYKGAQELIKTEMSEIMTNAGKDNGGRIDPANLSNNQLELLEQYLHCQETWQEVCLVFDRDDETGSATTLVLNRPLATKANEDLARMLLFGQWTETNVSQTEKLVNFLNAFDNECPIYIGGPDCHGEPAILIHGIADLEGAREISPGSAIYEGGLDAAIEGVMSGKYKPLEFRFFVGKHEYTENELDVRVDVGQYQPIACARPVALKQCIALPKPLWHEVMELCGGELENVSALELMKRDDLTQDTE